MSRLEDELPAAKRPWKERLPRALLAAGVGLLGIALVLELLLRALLFTDLGSFAGVGEKLRRPWYYADGDADDDYWKLLYRWSSEAPDAKPRPTPGPDPKLGWTGFLIEPGTYDHADAGSVGARRPVLLYGDSFAQCNTPAERCFQALMEQSDLGRAHALVNYGVGGYGFDQTALLVEQTIDRWVEQKPIVILSLLVESDLDRSWLSFRDWPKPRLEWNGSELVSAPVETNVEALLAADPVRIKSYLWRFFSYKDGALPDTVQDWMTGDHRRVAGKRALNRRIFQRVHEELAARDVEHYVLLFHVEAALGPVAWAEWQEPFVRAVCDELEIPLVSTRPFLLAAADGDRARARRYYGHAGQANGHLNALGNAVAFAAIREILEGRAENPEAGRIANAVQAGELTERFERTVGRTVFGQEAVVLERGTGPLLRYESDDRGVERVWIRSGELGPTRATFHRGEATTLIGRLAAVSPPGAECLEGGPWFSVELDGRQVFHAPLAVGADEIALHVRLGSGSEVSLVAGFEGDSPDCAWIRLEDVALE